MCFYSTEIVPSTAASVVVKCYAAAILIFQWVTTFLMVLTGNFTYLVISSFILATGVILVIIFWFKVKYMFGLLIDLEADIFIDKPYVHPLNS